MYISSTSRLSGSTITSKFIVTYGKLFRGMSPGQINPQHDRDRFFSDLLDLKVNRTYLQEELGKASKDSCTGKLKTFLSSLFQACTTHALSAKYGDVRKTNAIETQAILISRILAKNLSGWEVMEVLAGSVAESDQVFSQFTEMINKILSDDDAPPIILRQTLQLALAFVCGIEQLSPGAYFLRRDFFSTIVSLVKKSDTEQYTLEAVMLLILLANYHKSDAAKLNPYLKYIRQSTDGDFMRKVCWASNLMLENSVKSYQEIADDSPFALASALGSVLTRFRRDRSFSFTLGTSVPTDKFQYQPLETSVILLALFEFVYSNPLFANVLMEDLTSPSDGPPHSATPLFCNIVSFTSYLCTHASSIGSARSNAYVRLALNLLLVLVENSMVMEFTTQTNAPIIRICRQRSPVLSIPVQAMQPPMCSVLDCCVLWLRHNLHKRLEVFAYINCIWICHRVIWFLQSRSLRLNYDWKELWNAVIGLLNFLSTRVDTLHTTGGLEALISETVRFLDIALCRSEAYLPSPRASHELIYELVRSSSVLKNQQRLLKEVETQHANDTKPLRDRRIDDVLAHITSVVDFYEGKVGLTAGKDASYVMNLIAAEIEANGVYGVRQEEDAKPLSRSQDVLDFGRYGCADVRALLP